MPLERDLRLRELVFCGVGTIIGAGIYALVDSAFSIAKNGLWLSFLLASFSAFATGLSYALLSRKFPSSGAEFTYAERSLGKTAALFTAFLIIYASVCGTATVAMGFAYYFSSLIPSNTFLVSILLLLASLIVILLGIRFSAFIGSLATFASIVGLLLIIAPSLMTIPKNPFPLLLRFELKNVFSASSLIFFAFIGFEQITRLSEEAKNPKKDVPLAISIAIAITALLYLLISLAVIFYNPSNERPIFVSLAKRFFGYYGSIIISLVALFSTASTVLFVMLANSRIIYAIAREHAFPKKLAILSKRDVPSNAAILSFALSVFAIASGSITFIASASNFAMLLVFLIVNIIAFKEFQEFKFKIPALVAIPLILSLIMSLQPSAIFISLLFIFFFALLSYLINRKSIVASCFN